MKILLPADSQPQPPALPGISPFAPLRLCAFALKTQSSSHNQASIKAKTPAIVHNQGISRQPMKKLNATITSANGAAPYQPRATLWVRSPYMPPALQGRPTPQSRQKPQQSRLIVPHQGKRHFSNHHQFGAPTRWMGRIGRRMVKPCTQEKSSQGGGPG